MKIKHEYDDGPEYLTKDKVYSANGPDEYGLYLIEDDNGHGLQVLPQGSGALQGRPFTIVEP